MAEFTISKQVTGSVLIFSDWTREENKPIDAIRKAKDADEFQSGQ